jgi:hypothetical protein
MPFSTVISRASVSGRAAAAVLLRAGLGLSLCLAPVGAQTREEVPPSNHPAAEAALAEALGVKTMRHAALPGYELWCEDKADFALLDEPLRQAWEAADELLGEAGRPGDPLCRVVVVEEGATALAYRPLFEAECARFGIEAPGESFYASAAELGSGRWSFPPLVLIVRDRLDKPVALTRAVHDLGALRIGLAASEQAYGVPEFLVEGFAGMLVRRAVKKPAALVSHTGAAVDETIHGYGVFAGLGAALNDSSNHPGNWPTVMRNAAKAWKKAKQVEPEARIDALLMRDRTRFSRADYAYSWAVMEFLLDARFPVGEAAVAAAADRRWKPDEAVEPSRRAVLLEALAPLRETKQRLADTPTRAGLLLEALAEAGGEDALALQAAFQHWLETGLPKK